MQDLRLLDLDNRKGKAPGGYQSTLAEARLPFIFMNAVGLQRDVETILHEAGHAFHALATRDEDLLRLPQRADRVLRGGLDEHGTAGQRVPRGVLSPRRRPTAPAARIWKASWTSCRGSRRWMPSSTGSTRTPATRGPSATAAWLELMDRFGGDVDWSGYEAARANLWHRQLHIFLHPFYYIEYGIAQLGALQVWANSKRDKAKALKRLQARAGAGRLAAVAGIVRRRRLPVSNSTRATIKPLVELVRGELAKL